MGLRVPEPWKATCGPSVDPKPNLHSTQGELNNNQGTMACGITKDQLNRIELIFESSSRSLGLINVLVVGL
jgi:hypothetical protein